ncbi:MAG: hypothetical protein ACRC6A_04635 [Fusobacteriaceae bacterium]
MQKRLNIFYVYAINLFLISIPLIGKEREILRLLPIVYFVYLFVKNKIKIPKNQTLFYIILNIYILFLAVVFKNKDLITYIYIFSINIFLVQFEKNFFLNKLINSGLIFILLYLIFYLIGFLEVDFTGYRNRLYFTYLGKPAIMGAPFWGNLFYSLTVLIIIRYKSIKSILVGIILQILCYVLFDTRGPLLCSGIFIILFVIKDSIGNLFTGILLNITMFISIAASILFPFYFSQNYYLNKITSNRLIYWFEFLKERGFIGFFKISSVKALDFGGNLIIDNSFLHLIFNSGIYLSILIIILFIVAFVNLQKKKETTEMIFIISFLCYCFLESILFRYEVFATMYFWYLIIKNIKIKTWLNTNRKNI